MGRVDSRSGGFWVIDGITVEVNGNTRISGACEVGSKVEAIVVAKPNGGYLALSITQIGSPDRTPEPLEFMGTVEARDGSAWIIDGLRVLETGDTVLVNGPGVGDLVEVKAERRADGGIYARRITAIRERIVDFEGELKAKNGDTWQIGSRAVILTAETQIYGDPVIGSRVQVRAVEKADGRLFAQIISVVMPTPTPTATPTATATPEPTATPTATDAPEPTVTETATDAPEPTATATPEMKETTPMAMWMSTLTGGIS